MNCPKCGYAMSDFDVDCPRCKRMKGRAKTTPGAPPAPPSVQYPAVKQPAAFPASSLQPIPTPTQSRPNHPCTSVLAVIGGIVVFLIVSGVMCSNCMRTALPTESPLNQPGVTLSQYNQLQVGMSERDAFGILGPGTEISSNRFGDYSTVMYQWDGRGSLGANMNAMFQNGQLVQKAQFGLE